MAAAVRMAQGMSVPAYPAAHPARCSEHEGVVGDATRHDGARGDEAVAAEGDAADDRGVSANGGAPANERRLVEIAPGDLRAGIGYVGQHAGRTEEDVVLDRRAGVDGDVILDFDVVTD